MAGRYPRRVNNLFSEPQLRQRRLAGRVFAEVRAAGANRPAGCPERRVKRARGWETPLI